MKKVARINIESLKPIEQFVGPEDNPKYFFTMTNIKKIGINPRHSFNTPVAVCAYPVTQEYYKKLMTGALPFAGERPYINLFTISDKINVMKSYTEANLNSDINTLKRYFPEIVNKDLEDLINSSKKYSNTGYPIEAFWNLTELISQNRADQSSEVSREYVVIKTKGTEWGHLLRNLGYTNFYDPGMGLIHPNEPYQFQVYDPTVIIPINTYLNPYTTKYEPGLISSEDENILERRVHDLKTVDGIVSFISSTTDPKKLRRFTSKNFLKNESIFNSLLHRNDIPIDVLEKLFNFVLDNPSMEIHHLLYKFSRHPKINSNLLLKIFDYVLNLNGLSTEDNQYSQFKDNFLLNFMSNPLVNKNIMRYFESHMGILDDNIKYYLSGNPNTSPEVLRKLYEDSFNNSFLSEWYKNEIRENILQNPSSDLELLKNIINTVDSSSKLNLLNKDSVPENLLRYLAKDQDVNIRMRVADHKNTPLDVLRDLAKDDDFSVRGFIAANPNTPEDILLNIAKDSDLASKVSLTINPNITSNLLKILINDKELQNAHPSIINYAKNKLKSMGHSDFSINLFSKSFYLTNKLVKLAHNLYFKYNII